MIDEGRRGRRGLHGRGALVALLVVAAAMLAACGSGSAPDGLGPPEAAASVTRSHGDRDAFLAAMRACLPPDAFGATLAATLLDEVPEATAEQAACVHDNVVALAAPDQDRLYLYFANPAGYDVDDVGQAGTDLFASCDLAGGAGATTVPTVPTG